MPWLGLCNGCYGEPSLVCMHVLGGSRIWDKAISCLRLWREVITEPTAIGRSRRLEGNFLVSAAMATLLHSAMSPLCANMVLPLGSRPSPALF